MLHKERSSSSSEENPDYRCLKINVWNYVFYGFTDQSNSDQRVMLKMLQFKREHLLNMIKWRSMKIMKMSNIVTIYFLSICDSGSSLVLSCYQTIVPPVQCWGAEVVEGVAIPNHAQSQLITGGRVDGGGDKEQSEVWRCYQHPALGAEMAVEIDTDCSCSRLCPANWWRWARAPCAEVFYELRLCFMSCSVMSPGLGDGNMS